MEYLTHIYKYLPNKFVVEHKNAKGMVKLRGHNDTVIDIPKKELFLQDFHDKFCLSAFNNACSI